MDSMIEEIEAAAKKYNDGSVGAGQDNWTAFKAGAEFGVKYAMERAANTLRAAAELMEDGAGLTDE